MFVVSGDGAGPDSVAQKYTSADRASWDGTRGITHPFSPTYTNRPWNGPFNRCGSKPFSVKGPYRRLRHADLQHDIRSVGNTRDSAKGSGSHPAGPLRSTPASAPDERVVIGHGIECGSRPRRLAYRCRYSRLLPVDQSATSRRL